MDATTSSRGQQEDVRTLISSLSGHVELLRQQGSTARSKTRRHRLESVAKTIQVQT